MEQDTLKNVLAFEGYIYLYAVSKDIVFVSTKIMEKRSLKLGGKHWHQLFCLPTETFLPVEWLIFPYSK